MIRVLLVTAFVLMAACSQTAGSASSSARVSGAPAGTPLAAASGRLDAEVATPPNFPADVPVYPHARLTAGASFASSGEVAWGMEWETVDAINPVALFYRDRFNHGDWTMSVVSSTSTTLIAKVTRSSNSHFTGTLTVDSSPGVTKVLMSLVSAG
jgi:hypothetical protein